MFIGERIIPEPGRRRVIQARNLSGKSELVNRINQGRKVESEESCAEALLIAGAEPRGKEVRRSFALPD